MHDITGKTVYENRYQFNQVLQCSCGAVLETNTEIVKHIIGNQTLPVPYGTYPNQ